MLKEIEIELPEILPNEVLIRNMAISINPVDVRTRAGSAMASFLENQMPLTLGWDVSGVVEKVGSTVTEFKIGDEVFGLINFLGHGKGYAEYVVAPSNHLAFKPTNITHPESASACLAAVTAWQLLHNYAKIGKKTKILVNAASGGVGHYAVQIAKQFGSIVTGTSSLKNREFVLSIGADFHIAHDTESMDGIFDEFDIILDAFVGKSIDDSIRMIKPGGKILSLLPMVTEEQRAAAAQKGALIHYELVSSNEADMQEIAALLACGHLVSHIYKVFPFSEMQAAHIELEKGKTVGKIALSFP